MVYGKLQGNVGAKYDGPKMVCGFEVAGNDSYISSLPAQDAREMTLTLCIISLFTYAYIRVLIKRYV